MNKEDAELIISIKNIERLLRTLLKIKLKGNIEQELANPKNLRVYEMTGEKSRDQIAAETGLSTATISRLWQKWETIGLVEKEGQIYKRTL